GRLRLVRTGSVMSYYVSEGFDGEFRLLQTYRFSDEPLEDVCLVGSTGGPRAALDARFTHLHIRAPALTQGTGTGLSGFGGREGFAVPLALGLVLALALGLGVAAVRQRRAGKGPAPAAGGGRQAAPAVAFSCPNCGKGLKAKAELAGKKVKCP